MLSKAVGDLKSIEDLLKPDGGSQPRPPLWMLCQVFAQQALELIEKVEETTKIPAEFKKKLLASAASDQRDLRDVLNATRFMPSDEECAPHMDVIRRVYPKWEQAAELSGIPHKKM